MERASCLTWHLQAQNRIYQRTGQSERVSVTAHATSQGVDEMPKKTARESNGTPAPADAHDERVAALREEMVKHNVQAYIVPSEDPHMVPCLQD